MAKKLHEVTPEEFETGLAAHFPRGREDGDGHLPQQRWARISELRHEKWTYQPGAFFLGYRDGAQVGRVDDRHIVLVAGSRAGKAVSILTPNALRWPGSMLVLDPKGELAKLTARQRERGLGQRVHVLNPFPTLAGDLPQASFNPLLEIDPARDDDVAEKAALIADALIIHDGGGDSHWTDSARQLVHAIILYVLTLPKLRRNLITVRRMVMLLDLATAPPEDRPLDEGLYLMLDACEGFRDPDGDPRDDLNDLVQGVGRSFLAIPVKERGSIRSTAATQTAFLDSPKLAAVLETSSFALRDLKRGQDGKRVTVYL